MDIEGRLGRRVGYQMKRAEHALRLEMDGALRGVGLTTPQYAALSVLEDEAGLSGGGAGAAVFRDAADDEPDPDEPPGVGDGRAESAPRARARAIRLPDAEGRGARGPGARGGRGHRGTHAGRAGQRGAFPATGGAPELRRVAGESGKVPATPRLPKDYRRNRRPPASDAEHGPERVGEFFAGGGKVGPQPLVEVCRGLFVGPLEAGIVVATGEEIQHPQTGAEGRDEVSRGRLRIGGRATSRAARGTSPDRLWSLRSPLRATLPTGLAPSRTPGRPRTLRRAGSPSPERPRRPRRGACNRPRIRSASSRSSTRRPRSRRRAPGTRAARSPSKEAGSRPDSAPDFLPGGCNT